MPEDDKRSRQVPDRREIRVFISSTFRDMQEEREELVKQIFPQLRRLCESRGVTWGEVDLRWGVPDEAKAEGKVLPLCLQEIEHCRPYFIGLLGERYGWVPEEIPEALFETQPWLREHLHQSVTALEILHGVLLDPDMDKHAFFYFRDPAYAEKHPGFTEEDAALRERLAKLKDDIRRSGFPVSEPFMSPKQLGEWVLRDLTAVIEQRYPEKSIPDSLDRDAADHEAYSASRRTVYIGRQAYMDRLDAHAAGDGLPLVVVGESGGGKSALLANWTHRWSEQHPETPVLVHFIGAAPDSANWMAMLRRLLGEFQRKFGIQIEIPDHPDALRMTFANALHMVAAQGRQVLVLDALNQIEDRDGAPDLVWLPPVIPANVRLVVSTLPGRPWDELKKRNWPTLAVEPLTQTEREKLIESYLLGYGKKLDSKSCRTIGAASQTGNAQFLCTLLNELRLVGTNDELRNRISDYLRSGTAGIIHSLGLSLKGSDSENDSETLSSELQLSDLYERILDRWKRDYGESEPPYNVDIVREGLGLIYVSRHGLSETELLESLGSEGSPLPRVLWSPLYLAAGDALVNRGGLLTFANEGLRSAVWSRYMSGRWNYEGHGRRILAEYFKKQPLGRRQLDELPWQWLHTGIGWFHLVGLFTQPVFLGALWRNNPSEVAIYWTQIEEHSPLRMEKTYASIIQNPTVDLEYASIVASLLQNKGNFDDAFKIRAKLLEHYQNHGELEKSQSLMAEQASLLRTRGDLKGALALCKMQETLCRELDNKHGLSTSLGVQGDILAERGEFDGALKLYTETEQICREIGNTYGVSSSIRRQSRILASRREYSKAMTLSKEAERISRELGDHFGVADSLGSQGAILDSRGELKAASELFAEQEKLSRSLGNKIILASSLRAQALTFNRRRETTLAQLKCNEAIQLYESLNMIVEAGNMRVILLGLQTGRGVLDVASLGIIFGIDIVGFLFASRHPMVWIIMVPVLLVSTIFIAFRLSPRLHAFAMRHIRQAFATIFAR